MDDLRQHETTLTHRQRQIWLGQRLSPESPLYNMAFAWIFEAGLDVGLFVRAWQRVVEAQDVLRTRIVEEAGEPSRRILEPEQLATEVIEPGWSRDAEPEFLRWCEQRCSRPLALDGPLVDSVLVGLGEGKTGWYLNQHHLVTDAWSTALLYRQVAGEYAALVTDDAERPSPLGESHRIASELGEKPVESRSATEHWARRRARGTLAVPFYGHDGHPVGTASQRLTLRLDEKRSRALDRLASEPGFAGLSHEISRFALFASLLASWLHRVGDRDELSFDSPVAGRPTVASKRALGLFIELFPFAVTLGGRETFRSVAGKCLEEAQRFLTHALPGAGAASDGAAGNVVLNYIPVVFGDFAGLSAAVEWLHPGHGDEVHALRLQVHDFAGQGHLTFHFDINEAVLPERLRRRVPCHFERLIDALLADPDRAIASVDLLSDEERRELALLDATHAAPAPELTVLDRFLERARAEPDHVALRQGDRTMRFAQLCETSTALASTLVAAGLLPGDRVAILAPRSIEAVVAILAVLRAGAAYVPVDPAHPAERREAILRDSGARVVLLGEGMPEPAGGIDRLSIAEGIRRGEGVGLDRSPPRLDDLAYILYTSGSTGRPKGVLVAHDGLASYLEWAERQYVRGDRLCFALFTSLAFDLTVTSLFLPLITGGSLDIYPEPEGPVDSALIDVVRANRVDFVKLTPSHLALLRQMEPAGSRIRRMVVGGEDFKTRLAREVHAQLGGQVEIYNEYGPTEAVVGCVMHRFDPAKDRGSRVPIGGPADHVRLEVLGPGLVSVPEGVPGELWISRLGLARGYLGQGGASAGRFLPSPGFAERLGERRYRTGDRVRMVAPGRLEFLGRLDRQLKLSGFRIEPAEIEAALLALPGVEQCTVVIRRGDSVEPRPEDPPRHCRRCGLPSTYPRAGIDREGVCQICRSYEAIEERARAYFGTTDDLRSIFEASRRRGPQDTTGGEPRPDCLMLLSGGKDSTYALCRLVEMGFSVRAFTLDNGFIAERAKENIRQVTRQLGVPVEFATTPAMPAIFRDSLERFANVCQGCFKTIYTLATQRARELGIPIVVTGLSRGQMFETRLTEEMFRDGRFSPEEVDAAVLAARKTYHRLDDEVSRSLDVRIFQDDEVFEEVRFVDFYRYCDVDLDEMLAYLRRKVPWVRPEDTGRSTNCLINDVGIYVHKKQRGFHNYALPYSWDVRMGHKTRDEALAELDDAIDVAHVRKTLVEIGADPETFTADPGRPRLAAYYVVSEGAQKLEAETIRRRLAERLPAPLIPTHLKKVETIPLTSRGKVDEGALPPIEASPHGEAPSRAPEGPVEEYLAELWRERLGIDTLGVEDNFFALGGTSLGAMEIMIRLCREYDLDLPLQTLFAHPTLARLARVAEDEILAEVAGWSDAEKL